MDKDEDRAAGLVGMRVRRDADNEGGTIVEADADRIKVAWDGGETAYYRGIPDDEVRLEPT